MTRKKKKQAKRNRRMVRYMVSLISIPVETVCLVSLWLLLPKEDRAVLLSNANAFRVRQDIERARA